MEWMAFIWVSIIVYFLITVKISSKEIGKQAEELKRLNDLQEKNFQINQQRWETQNKLAEIDLIKWQAKLKQIEGNLKNESND